MITRTYSKADKTTPQLNFLLTVVPKKFASWLRISSTNPKDYEAIGIPELWIYRDRELHIYLFDGQHYQISETSPMFSEFPVKSLLPTFVEQAWQAGSSIALKAFEAYFRDR